MWDVIVIGSGIGGMAAAAALAQRGRRVLVLEQHKVAGGLTQTFRRRDWTFATGVHYIGGVAPVAGPDGQFGRMLDSLTGGTLRFAPCANPYDIVRLPGFEFGIPHPQPAYQEALCARFPGHRPSIEAWFDACERARRSAFALFAAHGAPRPLALLLKLLRGGEAEHWARHTLAEELAHIKEPRLRAVLGARWGDYGAPPDMAPFIEHALVTGSYDAGAWFPVGGPARFAQTLLEPLRSAGGEVRLGAEVRRIVVERGRARGVVYADGQRLVHENAPFVISAMGAAGTVACLEPGAADAWRDTLSALTPGLSYIGLYLGLEGDIAAAGASSANVWVYESEDVGRIWRAPADEDAPALFVSFPTLKDPLHNGPPTAEVVALVDPAAFARWLGHDSPQPNMDYRSLKEWVEARLLAQFQRHFPALAPMVRYHEASTPVTQRRYVRSPAGAMYGLEMSAERLTTPALRVRSPLPGLLLAGQDVTSPGVQGAFMGGWMAAAAVDPTLWARMAA